MKPTIGRIVVYRSRTGGYDVPAIITATRDTLNRKVVQAGYVPDLTDDEHVHLTVFTPGMPGLRKPHHGKPLRMGSSPRATGSLHPVAGAGPSASEHRGSHFPT